MDASNDPQPEKLPGVFREFLRRFPALGDAHRQIAEAARKPECSPAQCARSVYSARQGVIPFG